MIATHNGYRENDKRIPRIDVENYPAIKKHLDQYYPQLEKRSDKGETPYNLRNCAYIRDFEKEKIVYPETTQGSYFFLDINKTYIEKTGFILITKSLNLKFLQSILSSKQIEFYYRIFLGGTILGENGFQYNKHAIEQIPIPEIPEPAQKPFIRLVDEIIEIKKFGKKEDENDKDTIGLERKLDVMVYHLYGLSYEEACVIDEELKKELSKGDFEKYKPTS